MSSEKDYYAILGVSPDSDAEAVELAYERLAHEVQPNVDLEPTNPERMRDLDEAFDVLDDPARRAEYDRARRAAGDVESQPPEGAAGVAAVAAGGPAPDADDGGVVASEEVDGATGAEPGAAAVKKGRDGRLIAGIALLVGGMAVLVAGIVVLAITLTGGDDEGTGTSTGLEIEDTVAGTGAAAATGQVVTMHYTGTLEDGTEFDSSQGKAPISFVLDEGQVIPGLDEGVHGMQVGGQRTVVIPPELAFGEQGAGNGLIPPNATITFDIELVGVSDVPAESPPEVAGDEMELESGLLATDITEGSGDEAATGDTVYVHYTGWLAADGTRFDTSLGRDANTPAAVFNFTVGEGGVIDGWDAGVPGMKEGGKRRLFIPAALAYGDQAQGDVIPANADLIFDIELIEVAE